MAVGFTPMRAAVIVLLANTAPVAFGAVGTPIVTAGSLTGIDYHEIGAYVGHQTPLVALFVPFILVLLADGWRGLKETWPAPSPSAWCSRSRSGSAPPGSRSS